MKETGIIMSGNHPKLIMLGIKTMIRRTWGLELINKAPDTWRYVWNSLSQQHEFYDAYYTDAPPVIVKCPYGQAGDLLRVKETWATENRYNHLKPSEIPQTAKIYYLANIDYNPFEMGIMRPSIFMPRRASRITLEITEVRAERLQEISNKDVRAEGITASGVIPVKTAMLITGTDNLNDLQRELGRAEFASLWDSLNAKRGYGWETNPWVWPIGWGGVGVRLK